MENLEILVDCGQFSKKLHQIMRDVAPVVQRMEAYEFRYLLNNITPSAGRWDAVVLAPKSEIEKKISSKEFFDTIQIKPKVDGRIVLDENIAHLTQMLFVGLVTGVYPVDWVNQSFYFDPRSFNFYVRSHYLTAEIIAHLGLQPYRSFELKQKQFEHVHEIGYQEFKQANLEVDQCFVEVVMKMIQKKGVPVILAIAGPTAAGKTEIVERLSEGFAALGQRVAAIELDNFLTDRDGREEKGIGSFGKAALHFGLFQACIRDILAGKGITTPRYDFIDGTSSHDLDGNLKPGRSAVKIEPADVIFLEGNSPFLLPEIAPLIGIKVVYITDDAVRMKRKWRRDIDYRKKYDPYYFRNRYFKEQPPMAVKNYQPQLLACDVYVNTTAAEVWVTPQVAVNLDQ
jgi:uridine kinase